MATRTRWPADYFDGKTARKESVTVVVTERGLRLMRSDGTVTLWPYEELHQTQGTFSGEHVRFERGEPIPEALVVADPAIMAAIGELAPPDPRRAKVPMGGWRMARAAALALVGLCAASWGMYQYGLPAIADAAAVHVPVSWEEGLGQRAQDEMAPTDNRCMDPKRVGAVEAIVKRLVAAGPPSAYTYRVAISKSMDFNAFAAPGGYIVVNQGLLAKTSSPEELAGVLAHEIQHVERRHTTKAICEDLSSEALLKTMLGNADGFAGALNTAHVLGELGHSRKFEDEADREGMRLVIAAHIDPKGMLKMFEVMQGEGPEMPALLSDHPNTKRRLDQLKLIAHEAQGASTPIEVGIPWSKVAKGCS